MPTLGRVAIVTAGTSDMPVAEEVRETADWMGVGTDLIVDVGVAGPQRLLAKLDRDRRQPTPSSSSPAWKRPWPASSAATSPAR